MKEVDYMKDKRKAELTAETSLYSTVMSRYSIHMDFIVAQ
jgi:hypothetical protein